MYKLIVSDLDETLLNSDATVSEKNIEAINKARELGVKFVPASGRSYPSIQKTLKELGLYQEEGEYVIALNGGTITENKGNKLLSYNGLDFETVDRLFKKGLEYDDICIHIYTKDKVYVYNYNDLERSYLDGRMEIEVFTEPNIDFLKDEGIVKILFMNTDHDYLESIAETIENKDELDISYSAGRYLEFNKKGVNKGYGIKKLAELLGISTDEIIAVGDNYNDYSMIKEAGLGVGVNNTVESLKEKCDFITDATHNEDAIAEVIDRFILNS